MGLFVVQLAAYLEDQGQGTVGTDIFRFNRPPKPLACVSLRPTPGLPPDGYGEVVHPGMQIYARAATEQEALQKAQALFVLLHRNDGLDLGDGVDVMTMTAVQAPALVGVEIADDQTAYLAVFNVIASLRRPES